MFKTTTIWLNDEDNKPADISWVFYNPTPEERDAINAFAESLGADNSTAQVERDLENFRITSTRLWATRELAQTWTDYILANYNATSVTIDEVV